MRRAPFTGSLLLLVGAACSDPDAAPSAPPPTAGASGMAHAGAGSGGQGSGTGGAGSGMGGSGGSSGAGAASAGAAGLAGGAVADCEPVPDKLVAWPGPNVVKTLDAPEEFQSDLSGLTFEAETGVLWATNNLSSRLFRLIPKDDGFVPDPSNGWASGKLLRYPDGQGAPDAEGVTLGADLADGIFVCAEHDADDSGTSRLSVLRYDVTEAGDTLTATHEWDLTGLLPAVGANTGLEAISWIPDSYLVARGLFDESTQARYAPEDYADHGAGLFVVGVEQTGKLYLLALDRLKLRSSLVATIATPNPGVMGLEFDRDQEELWFNCDDTCANKSGILTVDTRLGSATAGTFVVRRQLERPSSLPDSNNEGIAIGSAKSCQGGFKPFFWTDDADADAHSLREGSIPCAACF